MTTTLPDGAVLRPATPADLDALDAVLTARGDADDGVDLRLVAEDPGLDGVAVVERDGRVVATATLLAEHVRIGSVVVPAGQVELVATDAAYEHRGYVRALMGWCHARSAARGDLLQVMIGIPSFYRLFGYAYAMPIHPWAPLAHPPPADAASAAVSGHVVRLAGPYDVPAMHALQEAVQARFDVAMPHSSQCWEWLVGRHGTWQWLVERDGVAVATARVTARPGETAAGDVSVGEPAGVDAAATAALLAAVAALGAPEVSVVARPHVPGLTALLGQPQRADWYYARVPDLAALLNHLRPELDRRLAVAGRPEDADLLISLWGSHVRAPVRAGAVGEVTAGGPMQTPVSSGGSGLPWDAVGRLLLGGGAASLEDAFPDAALGRQSALMEALFPPQSADLLTFYLP